MNLLCDGDILITRKGATVGKTNMFFNVLGIPTFVNEDIKVLRLDTDIVQKVFIGLFINSEYGQTQMLNLASRGTKQGLTNDNILNIVIPQFSTKKKKEIVKKYFYLSELKWDKNRSFVEYDNSRNLEQGIYQINQEIFRLKNLLNDVVNQIVKNQDVEIEYEKIYSN